MKSHTRFIEDIEETYEEAPVVSEDERWGNYEENPFRLKPVLIGVIVFLGAAASAYAYLAYKDPGAAFDRAPVLNPEAGIAAGEDPATGRKKVAPIPEKKVVKKSTPKIATKSVEQPAKTRPLNPKLNRIKPRPNPRLILRNLHLSKLKKLQSQLLTKNCWQAPKRLL